ncbi:MAG: hypothetical protein JSU63_05735 [Phycisphaerales bacterium]|nr:MAG: hypothetical protein JSU63_05735 [Phycisphaerales bacterium]
MRLKEWGTGRIDGCGAADYPAVSMVDYLRIRKMSTVLSEANGRFGELRGRDALFPVTVSVWARVWLWALLVQAVGCAARSSTFDILDYREGGPARRYRETMKEAYFDVDGQGNVDIVLRRSEPGLEDSTTDIAQVIHLRTVWRSIPGNTVAERAQINGTVRYHILQGGIGATFEGAGAIFCTLDQEKNALSGTLDRALLKPTRRLNAGADIFKHAQLTGAFRARRDHRRVARIINDMERLFGPHPSP